LNSFKKKLETQFNKETIIGPKRIKYKTMIFTLFGHVRSSGITFLVLRRIWTCSII